MVVPFSWGIVIIPVVVQFALCRFFYTLLHRKMLANTLSRLGACLIFCVAMAIVPWLVAGLTFGLGVYFYTYYPVLRPPSWDVGLIWVVFFLIGFSYLISAICSLIVCTRLFTAKRSVENNVTR
jgi:hypothetical protein